MLSDEGNENGKKTTIGLTDKKSNFARATHFFCTFLCRYYFRFPFSSYWALVVSALQDAGGYAISRQNNLELHLGCHTCWLSYFTFVCLWCGWTVGGRRSVYGHVITKFSEMGRFTYPWGSADARFAGARTPLKNLTLGRPRKFIPPLWYKGAWEGATDHH